MTSHWDKYNEGKHDFVKKELMTPTGNEDALKALERIAGREVLIPYHNKSQHNIDCLTIRTALIRSAQPDNDMRIKVLKEMGFEYLPVEDESGVLVSHAIVHPDDKGFFINHTNLMCAMQRIRIAVDVLARAKMQAQVDDLVKAFEKLTDTLECADICDCGNYDVSKQDAREARKALTQFTTKEKI